jgi:predicted phage-related endonuclease
MDDQRSQFAEEKAALEQDMIRRAREIEAERVLAEARQAIAPVAKSYTPPRRRAAAAPAADMTAAWRDYIDARIKRAEARTTRACMAAVGEVIGKDMVAAERRIEQLEREVAELRERLEQDQRGARLRTVPSPTALIA